VREEVSKKFGEDFLLEHEVNQLESSMMEIIKSNNLFSLLTIKYSLVYLKKKKKKN
jgi:hypothetical protein